ncbi:hypothetical protein BgiBS90_004546 [Biomphalaria glabrata]|nr:hypothetical protein BgiBS90_004545 [Biomphalaria glabrata]KAI8794170.1 hypothetical protein BgiBS90_004546 [Biomphalaria glabrata]
MVSRMKEGVDSLVKEQLPVDSLVKKLRGQDCGCTNSGDGDAGNWSAVCVCVVGKSCGCEFQDEKRDNDCCDDLNEMYRIEGKVTNEETEDLLLMRTPTMKALRPFLIPCLGCRRVKLRMRAPTMAEAETTNLTLAAA